MGTIELLICCGTKGAVICTASDGSTILADAEGPLRYLTLYRVGFLVVFGCRLISLEIVFRGMDVTRGKIHELLNFNVKQQMNSIKNEHPMIMQRMAMVKSRFRDDKKSNQLRTVLVVAFRVGNCHRKKPGYDVLVVGKLCSFASRSLNSVMLKNTVGIISGISSGGSNAVDK